MPFPKSTKPRDPSKPPHHSTTQLCNRPSPIEIHSLPPDVRVQSALAQKGFALLISKPGRTLASIANALGVSRATVSQWSQAGRWSANARLILAQDVTSLVEQASQEAHRSRAAQLALNRQAEEVITAAFRNLVTVNESGQLELAPGVDLGDVARVTQARNVHLKTTAMITGEEAAQRTAAAAAGAAKVIIQAGSIRPEPVPVQGSVVSPAASPTSTMVVRE